MCCNEINLQNLPQNLTSQEMCNPYIVIRSFFSEYHLPLAIRQLNKWVTAAFAQKSRLGKSDTLALLDLGDQLVRLLEASQLLNDDVNFKEKALDLTNADDATLLNTALYYTPHRAARAWECFPRHLSISEYGNPYLVFDKCLGQLSLSGWRRFIKDLFHAATYDMQIYTVTQDDDLRKTYRCLFKLLEACHLIKVREIDPDDNSPVVPVPSPPIPTLTPDQRHEIDEHLENAA